MRHREIRRSLLLGAICCAALLALGCGGVGLAVRQRAVELPELRVGLGPLRLITQASHPIECPPEAERRALPCYQYRRIPREERYRLWLFMHGQRAGHATPRSLLRLDFELGPRN
jgi:hypothetical protein